MYPYIQNRIECKRVVRLRVRVVGAAGAGNEAAGAGRGALALQISLLYNQAPPLRGGAHIK